MGVSCFIYPCIRWWALELFPLLVCCEKWCDEHLHTSFCVDIYMFLFLYSVYLGIKLLGHTITLYLQSVLQMKAPFYIPSSNICRGFQFLHILANVCILCFKYNYPSVCEAGSHWVLFPFPWWLMMLRISSGDYWPFVSLICRNVYLDPLTIF